MQSLDIGHKYSESSRYHHAERRPSAIELE